MVPTIDNTTAMTFDVWIAEYPPFPERKIMHDTLLSLHHPLTHKKNMDKDDESFRKHKIMSVTMNSSAGV